MTTILIVDDDMNILELVATHLREEGYNVTQAKDGTMALQTLKQQSCDLAIVDVMMPFMDGFSLTKEIRKNYDIPIILLTAKSQISDKKQGYEAGTDDYLVKPFEPDELLFRVQALLRRYDVVEDDNVLKAGNIIIHKDRYEVQVEDRSLFLPPKEFELLCFLMTHQKQTFSREQLIEQVWGMDFIGDDRTVDVHIKRLREHFKGIAEHVHIKTIRGVGYMLEEF
ncbi:response regulator transcription factor [Rummeliibacillus pycnus]|uniref:response regulator transcription factor n=1 Tax=Rummeliibacillus pycnus TaxID=101070 RepID=UPI003D2D9ADE